MTLNEHTEVKCYSNDCNTVNKNNLQHCNNSCNGTYDTHNQCHRPLRLWSFKYVIAGTSKFVGQALVQAPTLKEAECILGKDSRFNGFPDRIKITCIEEILPNNEPVLLQEDSVAILDKAVLKSYPFVLKSDIDKFFKNLHDEVIVIKNTLVSPTLTETKTEDGYNITIKDADGERDISIKNGEKGEKGDTGENGATFTPNVDENGIITWTNDGGLENPQSVSIKGVKGDNGITPHIGVNGNWYIGDTDTGVPSQAHFIDDTVTIANKTWSSSKIQQKLDSIDLANFKVVNELPTENISPNVIYLVPKPNSGNENIKDEYVYEEDHWELIGDTSIDLSEYITNDILNEKLAEYKNLKAGIATEIKDNKINVRYDPEFLMVDKYNRLTLKYKIKAWLDMDEEEGGGSSGGDEPSPDIPTPTIYDALKQISDLDTYDAQEGEIVQYVGPTNDKYINGYTYKYQEAQGGDVLIPAGTKFILINKEDDLIKNGTYTFVERETSLYFYYHDISVYNFNIHEDDVYYMSDISLLKQGDYVWKSDSNKIKIDNISTTEPPIIFLEDGTEILYRPSGANYGGFSDKYINEDGDVIYVTSDGLIGVSRTVANPESVNPNGRTPNPDGIYIYTEGNTISEQGILSGTYDTPVYNTHYEWIQKDVQPNNSQDTGWINI